MLSNWGKTSVLNYKLYGTSPDASAHEPEPIQQPPLVVLHGLLGSLDNWHSFARRYTQATEQTMIAIDLRNHGESPHVDGMSYRLMSDDIRSLLAHLQLTTIDLMGHSMGGKVAMNMALQATSALNIRKLIVVDIAPVTYPARHQALLQAMLTMPLASFTSRREADQWLAPTIKHPFERGFLLKNLKRSGEHFEWQCNLPEIAKHYLKISGFPVNNTHTTFDKAALFIDGGQSDYITDEHWQTTLTLFPNAQRETLEEAGHLPHVQMPAEFMECVQAFMRSDDGTY